MIDRMREHSHSTEPSAVTPASPILLLGAGTLGGKTLQALPEVAAVLRLRLWGPFGFAYIIPEQEGISRSIRLCRSIPAADSGLGRAPKGGTWEESLRSLVRRLRPAGSDVSPAIGPRARLQVYAVMD